MKFEPAGPPRYAHQKKALRRIIETRGVHALLMEPGTGKTAVALDYLSILALKNIHDVGGIREVRALVISPKAAVDNWVLQAETYVHPGVNVWAEALGGSIKQKAETFASRGPFDFKPRGYARMKDRKQQPHRGINSDRAELLWTRGASTRRPIGPADITALGRPRLILLSTNLDTFASRASSGSGTIADTLVKAVTKFEPDVIVVDECHPAGTHVETPAGPRPIEELKVGDEVLCYNGEGVETTRITHTFKRETEEPLWALGGLKATPEHPVWTETRGFVPISDLEAGDEVVRVLRGDVLAVPGEDDATVLFEVVQQAGHVPGPAGASRTAGRPPAGDTLPAGGRFEVVGSLAGALESVSEPGGLSSWLGDDAVEAWLDDAERGKWDGVDLASAPTFTETRLGYGSRGDYRLGGTVLWLPESLQGGHRGSGDDDRGGDRWGVSSVAEGSGPAEGRVPPEDRLGRVSLHEPAGSDGPGQRRHVYNIETEAGTYIAGGYVVHNSHKIKGPSSNTSRLVARIGERTDRRLILTGTVMPHSPMDVFAQWRFLKTTAFGEIRDGERQRASFTGFQRKYGVMGGFMGREVVSYRNLDEMQAIMADNATVVRKEDALDLPQMTDTVIPITLSSAEQRAYEDMKKNLAASLASGQLATAPNKLAQMMRLRQITSGHLPDGNGAVAQVGTSKVDAINSLVTDTLAGEKRVVVFGVFRQEIADIEAAISNARGEPTDVIVITGDTAPDERLSIRRRFGSSDPRRIVLIAQVKTISLSVNELVTASHAVFATLSLQRDDLVQARDRLNRIGQTRPCTFWYPLARGTVDEITYRSHQGRTDLEAAVLEHVREADGESSTPPPPLPA